uniref:Uncharacterized protein n=1 Tax=Tanacetum cinerariifolium TaxID=118510 RepID=A0A699H1F8_TANCI|nr:hypothetical protein [Tanacetum cinerariifolium]
MANQEQAPQQQEMAKNLVPFTHAKQVGFNLEDVILNTNNEVALLYPEHSTKEIFLSKALDNSNVSFLIPTGGIYGVLRVNTFRKAIGAHYPPYSSDYVDPPSIEIVEAADGINYPVLRDKTRGFDQITNKDAIILYCLANGVNIDHAMIFCVNNRALKPDQTEGPPFTAHMMAICNVEKPVAFKAPRTFSQTKMKVSQDTKPGAKTGHKKHQLLPNNLLCLAVRQQKPPVSTHVDTKKHKDDQQAAGGPTSLGVTSEKGAHPQLSSGYDASADSTAEADPKTSAVNDSFPPQQGKDKRIKNYSLDHIFAGTDLNVLADKTKSVSDGLEIILTTPETRTRNAAKPSKEIKFGEIMVEDLEKLMLNVKADFKDLDSPEDDPIIVVDDGEEDEDEDNNDEIHSTINDETEDT